LQATLLVCVGLGREGVVILIVLGRQVLSVGLVTLLVDIVSTNSDEVL